MPSWRPIMISYDHTSNVIDCKSAPCCLIVYDVPFFLLFLVNAMTVKSLANSYSLSFKNYEIATIFSEYTTHGKKSSVLSGQDAFAAYFASV